MTDIFQNMTYNMSQIGSAETVSDIVKYANDSTGSLLGSLFVILVFMVCLMVMKKESFLDAFMASSFLSFILSLIMTYGNMVSFIMPIIFGTLFAFSVLYTSLSGK